MLSRWHVVTGVTLAALAAWASAMDVAGPYVGADFMWSKGYTGSGVEVGIIDLFTADNSHPAIAGNFRGSFQFAKGARFVSSHATSVAGAVASQDATWRGIAPAAGWWSGQTCNRGSNTNIRFQTTAAETFGQGLDAMAGNPAEVITMSIGVAGSTNGLDQWSLALDHIADTNGSVITVAAGNSGPGGNTIDGLPAGAYNIITVGATGDTGGAVSQDYSNVAHYSSRGRTADGRSKPDIVAPGSLIRMPELSGGWTEASGTSFATPIVAGGAALLVQMGRDRAYSTDPKVIKGVLLNSARKLSGWTHTSWQPLDIAQGAGEMDLRAAYRQYLSGEKGPGAVPGIAWDRGIVAAGGQNLYDLDVDLPAGAVITATLDWDRIVSTDTEDIDKVMYSLSRLANLDLNLYGPGGSVAAASVSTIDNVEHVYYTLPAAGRYQLGVRQDGGVAETYALTWRLAPSGTPLAPDATLDGRVNVDDLGILASNYGASDRTWFSADFTGDGNVNVDDLGILATNYDWASGGQSVPEPATLSLLALGGLATLRPAKRRFPS